jgi:hypothetical protein
MKSKLTLLWLLLIALAACAPAAAPSLPTVAPSQTALPPTVTPVPPPTATPAPRSFDGDRAFDIVADQMAFGPRYPGSPGHDAVRAYIVDALTALDYAVEQQEFEYQAFGAVNIIGRANVGRGPIVILGAHYDTRRVADQSGVDDPVPGAVDGASGVGVILELGRVLDLDQIDHEIWLTFFDVEDNGGGGIDGWSYIAGSTYMAQNLTPEPPAFAAMVLVDMIGDADQQLYYEGNSDPVLRETLWQIAADLGYGDYFIPQLKFTMIDDHVPFSLRGIPAVDIIDFDYPYWHTVDDTLDKVGADSLARVGRVIEVWLEEANSGAFD